MSKLITFFMGGAGRIQALLIAAAALAILVVIGRRQADKLSA
jgi:hypothetical protein